MQGGGGHKKRFQYCTDSSEQEILYLRALQRHSGRSLIDPSLHDNVLIPDNFFEYIYHVGCAINLHSIINSGLIPESQNLSKRQTVLFLPVDPMDKNHKDPDTINLEAPRHAQYMHKAWKKHQNTVYWVDINLALKKGLKFWLAQSLSAKVAVSRCKSRLFMQSNEGSFQQRVWIVGRFPGSSVSETSGPML